MKRRLYIYQPEKSLELFRVFKDMSEELILEKEGETTMILTDCSYFNEEPIDIEGFYYLLVDDFSRDFTVFIEPFSNETFTLMDDIIEFLPQLPKGIYYFDDLIIYTVIKQNKHLKNKIKDYIMERTNSEVVHSVREFINNNMNSSVSAKKLYMHRNTLNYRIDNFIESTHINVKSFKGANAIYMLFKY
jgi:IS1 family transposase